MPDMSLRVVSYNIRKALGTDRRRDPARILAILRDLHADIVMLQEADRRPQPRPAVLPVEDIQDATGLVPVPPGGGGPSMGAHGNALLVHPSFQVTSVEARDLPGLEPRGLLSARLVTPSGRKMRVVGTHLGLLRHSRRRQVSALRNWLDPAEPTIIAGDFNERDPVKGLEDFGPNLHPLPPRASFHARLPRWPLDRIVISEHFEASEPEVILDARTRLASDHLPLLTTIREKSSPRR